jgi:Ca-activated chloride channel homolog
VDAHQREAMMAPTARRTCAWLAVVAALALGPRARPAAQVFTARTVGVRVDALVTANGVPIAGLTAEDFDLEDNGVRQKIGSVDSGDMPVNVVLAFDESASTSGKRLADLQAATGLLVGDLRPIDKAALTTFNHAVAPRVPLTSDFRAVQAAVDGLQPSGGTALLEGAYAAVVATLAEPGRSFVIVCTDGRDTTSWLQPEDLIDSAKHSNAVVYVVASSGARRWAPLKSLADATGGRMIEIQSSAQIAGEFQKILQDFRSRYVLTYVPAGVAAGGYHRLDVRVRRPGMKVTARPGYF